MNRPDAAAVLKPLSRRKIKSVYDRGEVAQALAALLPSFEYPDWSYKTVGEFLKAHEAPKRFDAVGFIMAAEAGEIEDEEEFHEGVQAMIDSGVVWHLQGSWTRTATMLILSGDCHR